MWFAIISLQGFEYHLEFENEEMRLIKVKIEAYEEIGLHLDDYSQIVVALKGGTITRLEADGRKVEVIFPTRVPVIRGIDPEGELHRALNNSPKALELMIIQLKTPSASP